MKESGEETGAPIDCDDTWGDQTRKEKTADVPTARKEERKEREGTDCEKESNGKVGNRDPNSMRRGRPTKAAQLAREGRKRANRVGILDIINRKKEREEEKEKEREDRNQQTFKRSTITARSPGRSMENRQRERDRTGKGEGEEMKRQPRQDGT